MNVSARYLADFSDEDKRRVVNVLPNLTRRELEVFHLWQQGMTSKETAERLFISHRTVETYRRLLLNKFECRNMIEIVSIIASSRVSGVEVL